MLDAITIAKRSLVPATCVTAIVVACFAWPSEPRAPARERAKTTGCAVSPLPPRPYVHVARGTSGCTGETLDVTFTVHPSGNVDWRQPHMPLRQLSLLPDELELLDKLGARESREEPSYHVTWYKVATGDPALAELSLADAEYIPSSSVAGVNLDEVFDAAQARYRHKVLGLGRLRGSFIASEGRRVYRLEINGNQVEVKRGKRVVVRRELTDAEVVDLIDLARTTTEYIPIHPEVTTFLLAHGELTIGGAKAQLDLVPIETGPLAVLYQMLLEAT